MISCTAMLMSSAAEMQKEDFCCLLLITYDGALLSNTEKSSLYYGDVDVVVIDEADTMFDRGFGPEVGKVLVHASRWELHHLHMHTHLVVPFDHFSS